MGKFTFLIAFMLASICGYGQVSGYTFSQSTGNTYTEITGGTVVVTCTNCTESYDSSSWVIALPTAVPFNGTNVTSVVMRADGSLVMGSTTESSAAGPLAATTVATGVISPLGMDLRSSTVAGSTYELRWEELANSYVFQWKNAARWSQNTTEKLNFQVWINKTTGVITMAYGGMTVANSTTYQPVVGLRGTTNTDYINRRLTTTIPDASPSWEDTAAGTSNSHNVRFTTGSPAAIPAEGLNYVWTPPTCFAPTSASVSNLGYNSTTVQYTAPQVIPSNGYEFYIATANTAPDAAATPAGTSATTSFTFNGLTADTVYYYWLRSNCSGTTTSWVYGGTFRTDCAPVTPPTALETFAGYSGSIPATCWREATGILGAAPIALTGTSSNWTNQNYHNTAGTDNGTSAYINLDGVDNEWIISPIYNLGDGSIDYQIEYTASVIPFSGTDPVTTMDEKFVKVVVSTDGGQTWSEANVVQTYNSGNIPVNLNAVVNLAAYSGNIKIGFYGYSTSADGVDLRFYIDNFRIIPVPSCFNPSAPVISAINETTATLNWSAAAPAPANGYQYYVSTSATAPAAGATPTGSVGAGVLTANLTSLVPSTSYHVWVRSNCGSGSFSEWIAADVFMTLCDAFDILTTTATPVCGQGTSTLNATVSGGNIEWFSQAVGGSILGTGSTYTTPQITETTTYYVSTYTVGTATSGGARVAPTSTAGTSPSDYGLVFDVYSGFTLNSVDVYLKGTSADTVEIELQDNTGAVLQSVSVAVPAGDSTNPVLHTINLGFSIAPGTGYKLMAVDGPSMVRESSLGGFPYAIGTSGQVTSGYLTSVSSTYYYFYNWNFTPLCYAPRVAVTATVTPAPAIDATVTAATICNGESTTLNVTSANAGYTYVWMPGNLTGASQTVTPTATTTYTVTATDTVSGCVTTDQVTVTVNAVPSAIAINNVNVCLNDVSALTVPGINASTSVQVGSGTATNITSTPFKGNWGGSKTQALYTAAELAALGLEAGASISSIGYVVLSGTPSSFNNFTINVGLTAQTSVATFSNAATTQVFSSPSYTPAGIPGTLTFNLATPLVWDGVSNLLVETCFNNVTSGSGSATNLSVQSTTVASGLNSYLSQDNNATVCTNTNAPSTTTNRPNLVVAYTNSRTVTWSPATNLFTDAAATTAYTAGANASTVYVKSSTAGTTSYTVTVANVFNCSVSDTFDVSIIATPAVTATDITLCNGSTVANLSAAATGDNLKWYNVATGGTPLASTEVLASGTYYVSQTQNGCEGPRTSFVVTINTTDAPVTTNATFCNAEPTVADLTPYATGAALQWYDVATGGTALATTTALTAGTYYVSQTLNGCESSRATVTVTLNTTAAPATTNAAFCNVAPTVADLAPYATGTALQWYDVATGGTALVTTTALTAGTYYVSQTINGCEGPRATVTVAINTTAAPATTNATFCNAAPTVADLDAYATGIALQWYDVATGGTALASTTALTAGTYYVSQTINGCEGPRGAVVVTLNTTAAPTATDLTFCNAAPTVADILGTITGTGLQLYDVATGGTALATTATVSTATYYVSQIINGCESSRDAFTITVNTTDAPAAPAAQSFCGSATVANLEVTGTAVQWYSTQTGDTPIASTTALVNGTTYYVSQTVNGCESARTGVTVTVTTVLVDDINDQTVCGTYTLPALTNGNYFGGANGTGTAYTAGDIISADMTMYIFNQVGDCTAETSFTIDVNVVAAPAGNAVQAIEVTNLADATIEDLVVTVTGTLTWYPTEADALAGTNAIAAGTQLVNGEDYFAVQTIDGCTSAPFEVTVTVTLGRNDFTIQNIKVYPNPVVEKLVITYSSNITLVEVYDLLGKRVIVEQPNTTTAEINMGRLEAATYIVKVTADGMTKDVKVVKRN